MQLKPSSTKQFTTAHGMATGDTTTTQSSSTMPQGVQGATGNQFKVGRGRGLLVYNQDIRKPQNRS